MENNIVTNGEKNMKTSSSKLEELEKCPKWKEAALHSALTLLSTTEKVHSGLYCVCLCDERLGKEIHRLAWDGFSFFRFTVLMVSVCWYKICI